MIASIVGGIGLFLLGMVLLVEGLRATAGVALRDLLSRFTGGTLSAIASGAAVTAVVQSSSATIVTTIGFVSAGLLSFTQALGVILGANIGTTSTGWIVSLLGLKLSVASAALPLIAVGAILRLLSRGPAAQLGTAIAGFGLIFVGIDFLQGGMQELGTQLDPARFPGQTVTGRLLLVGLGALLTVVMQSSSAAVAATLTALHSGAIDIEQAAALVVGQNVGTTVTAALAAIGASVPARRAALAHILFNVLTATVAFLVLPAVLSMEAFVAQRLGQSEPAVLIAGFHTAFNLLGVLLVAPFVTRFARLITRLIPDRGPALTRYLDSSVTRMPPVAMEAARRTVLEINANLVDLLRSVLERPVRDRLPTDEIHATNTALAETRRFLAQIPAADGARERSTYVSLLHAIDHLDRLVERLGTHTPVRPIPEPTFDALRARAATDLAPIAVWLHESGAAAPSAPPAASVVGHAAALYDTTAGARRNQRKAILDSTADGAVDPDIALEQLEALRWLDSVIYHVWRAMHHLTPQAESAGS